ncbi:MAG: hypothetical protein H6621_06630 [Halobacteriovoraceae bacterium]|nr:hypothetical protein [Halobacteriovoraceae bacterium]
MSEKIKRKHTRFPSDPNTLVRIKLNDGTEVVGLAFSEAYGGCGGAFIKNPNSSKLQVDDVYEVKVGDIDFLSAKIRWVKLLDENILKIGFQID